MTTTTSTGARRTANGREQLHYNRFRQEPTTTFVRHHVAHPIRSTEMSLFVEDLARDRMRQAQRDAETYRLARRLRTARREAARKAR
jgi:hypothetical protein